MATSSEKGIRILDETTFYWAWSTQGPADHGIFYGRFFEKGIVPLPLPGDVAADLEARGFYLTPYVPGEWFSGWEREENHSFHQRPVFKPVVTYESFPPAELPEKLPDDWVEFFSHYTAGGKLKREHRGLAIGLKQAQDRKFVDGPNMVEAQELADKCEADGG